MAKNHFKDAKGKHDKSYVLKDDILQMKDIPTFEKKIKNADFLSDFLKQTIFKTELGRPYVWNDTASNY